MKVFTGSAAVAALALAVTMGAAPASAQLAHSQALAGAAAMQDSAGNQVTQVQWRRGGYYRGGYGYRRGPGWGGVGAGFAAGALLGGAIAAQSAPYGYGYGPGPYYAPAPVYSGDTDAYCFSRFKSYDPASGTYLGYDGLRHPCP